MTLHSIDPHAGMQPLHPLVSGDIHREPFNALTTGNQGQDHWQRRQAMVTPQIAVELDRGGKIPGHDMSIVIAIALPVEQ
jgi:hypothetical protein